MKTMLLSALMLLSLSASANSEDISAQFCGVAERYLLQTEDDARIDIDHCLRYMSIDISTLDENSEAWSGKVLMQDMHRYNPFRMNCSMVRKIDPNLGTLKFSETKCERIH